MPNYQSQEFLFQRVKELLPPHASLVDTFIQKFNDEVKKLKCGMPWDAGVNLTPLPEPGKTDFLKGLVEDAKLHGAKVMNEGGGEILNSFFYIYSVKYMLLIISLQ